MSLTFAPRHAKLGAALAAYCYSDRLNVSWFRACFGDKAGHILLAHITFHLPEKVDCEALAAGLLAQLPPSLNIPFDYGAHPRPLSGMTERDWYGAYAET
jgi:hypothetical protein